ncbi:hypothetical protein AnigIFM60653_005318 [Aspergillus niger]|nr:hypothetical protein AnigIFM56816_004481 [Aspergillus niger]GKZ99569.1 hypothetical protein AnigIFM60653_005318 [Aspergillus niger]
MQQKAVHQELTWGALPMGQSAGREPICRMGKKNRGKHMNPPDLIDAQQMISRLPRYVSIGMTECDRSRVGGCKRGRRSKPASTFRKSHRTARQATLKAEDRRRVSRESEAAIQRKRGGREGGGGGFRGLGGSALSFPFPAKAGYSPE